MALGKARQRGASSTDKYKGINIKSSGSTDTDSNKSKIHIYLVCMQAFGYCALVAYLFLGYYFKAEYGYGIYSITDVYGLCAPHDDYCRKYMLSYTVLEVVGILLCFTGISGFFSGSITTRRVLWGTELLGCVLVNIASFLMGAATSFVIAEYSANRYTGFSKPSIAYFIRVIITVMLIIEACSKKKLL